MNVILTETLQLYGDDENPWLQAQHLPLNNAEFKIIEHGRKNTCCMHGYHEQLIVINKILGITVSD